MHGIKILLVVFFLFFYSGSHAQPINKISFQTADSLYFENEWSHAIDLYKQLLKDTSSNSVEWQRLAFCYYNLGNTDEALKYFKNLNPQIRQRQCCLIYIQEWQKYMH